MIDHDPASIKAAIEFLRSIGAPLRLLRHGEIVAEVAVLLSTALVKFGVEHDVNLVVVGAAIHDSGKVAYPQELSEPGNLHEAAGEILLIENGISPKLARVCRAHGTWKSASNTFEEQLIALADHLWKGCRNEPLERYILEHVAVELEITRWEAFLNLDPLFEKISCRGAERLAAAALQ